VTPVAEDYLKVVWSAHEWSDEPVTTSWLADRLGVGASTVSETVKRLTEQGLLDHERYGDITLTAEGRSHALRMVRRHRVLETFLVAELGYGWDEVHVEAEVLEHAVSDDLVDRMHERLGRPARDPHGDPIPTADGVVEAPEAIVLAELTTGHRATVARIWDADPQLLRYLADLRLGLDAVVEVTAVRDFAGTLTLSWWPAGAVETDPARELELGLVAAGMIWVVPR
jgi:DtxR family Mn-dependent transcriptional regulator